MRCPSVGGGAESGCEMARGRVQTEELACQMTGSWRTSVYWKRLGCRAPDLRPSWLASASRDGIDSARAFGKAILRKLMERRADVVAGGRRSSDAASSHLTSPSGHLSCSPSRAEGRSTAIDGLRFALMKWKTEKIKGRRREGRLLNSANAIRQ